MVKFLKLKGVLGAVAPTLGQAMAGPLGKSAGDIVAKVLGCEPTPQAIEQSMQEITPEQLAAIKEAELEFEAKMKQMDVDLFALETKDAQNARKYFAGDWFPKAFAFFAISFSFGYIFLVTIQPPDANSDTITSLVLGNIFGMLGAIVSFYFGASNPKKDD
jgi:hypothetical protein